MAEACASIAVADCARIWFLARSAASAAKSASSILDRVVFYLLLGVIGEKRKKGTNGC